MLSFAIKCAKDFSAVASDLIKDESGSATLEYSAAGGVMTGLIFFAFHELRTAQSEGLARALSNIG